MTRLRIPILLNIMAACAFATNETARADDVETCISAAKQASVRCWDRCTGDDYSVRRCTDTCDDTLESRKQQCLKTPSGTPAKALPKLSGTKQGGQDGCYFGECPKDLEKKIDQSTDPPEEEEEPVKEPPKKKQFPPRQQSQPRVQMTGICQTLYLWCYMNQTGPVGSSCWCPSTFGPITGITVPQQ